MSTTRRPFLLTIALFLLPCATLVRAQDVVWDANTVELESHQIGARVYAVIPAEAYEKVPRGLPAATSGGFIVGERGVLVVDTMLNARLAGQLIGLIREVTDLPIRYIVNTSYHVGSDGVLVAKPGLRFRLEGASPSRCRFQIAGIL